MNDDTMAEVDICDLLRQFAAPLADYAASSLARHEGADFMVRTLWTAMIAGPEMEEETWKAFREIGHIPEDDLRAIQDCYYQQMKPVVTPKQLAALQKIHGLKRKA